MRPSGRRFSGGLIAVMVSLAVFGVAAAKTTEVSGDMSQGNSKAKVTVIEYASVACPICGRWFKEVYPAFKAKYIDTGKVHFVTREMLVGDQGEVSIASAGFMTARCAGKDNYYKVTDAIYLSQPGLYDKPFATLMRIAASVGLTPAQFRTCVTNQAAMQALNDKVRRYSEIDHIDSTPTFVINGKPLEPGYHPLTELDAAIASAEPAK